MCALTELVSLVVRLVQRVELGVRVRVEVPRVELELLLWWEGWREVGRLEIGGGRHTGGRSEAGRSGCSADTRDGAQAPRVPRHPLLQNVDMGIR